MIHLLFIIVVDLLFLFSYCFNMECWYLMGFPVSWRGESNVAGRKGWKCLQPSIWSWHIWKPCFGKKMVTSFDFPVFMFGHPDGFLAGHPRKLMVCICFHMRACMLLSPMGACVLVHTSYILQSGAIIKKKKNKAIKGEEVGVFAEMWTVAP